jgi:hypothetical protein
VNDVVIDLYTNIVFSGAPDDVVDWLLSVPDEAGRKVIVGATRRPLSVEDYLAPRTIRLGVYRVKMVHPSDR